MLWGFIGDQAPGWSNSKHTWWFSHLYSHPVLFSVSYAVVHVCWELQRCSSGRLFHTIYLWNVLVGCSDRVNITARLHSSVKLVLNFPKIVEIIKLYITTKVQSGWPVDQVTEEGCWDLILQNTSPSREMSTHTKHKTTKVVFLLKHRNIN